MKKQVPWRGSTDDGWVATFFPATSSFATACMHRGRYPSAIPESETETETASETETRSTAVDQRHHGIVEGSPVGVFPGGEKARRVHLGATGVGTRCVPGMDPCCRVPAPCPHHSYVYCVFAPVCLPCGCDCICPGHIVSSSVVHQRVTAPAATRPRRCCYPAGPGWRGRIDGWTACTRLPRTATPHAGTGLCTPSW